MADLDLISEATIQVSSSGVTETAAAVNNLGMATDKLVVSQDGLSKAQIRVNAQLEATAKKYDAEYRALTELTKATNLLDRAQSQGLAHTEAYARIQENVTLKLQAQANAARLANEAQQKLATTIRDQAQATINAATGVNLGGSDIADRAADIAAYGAELDRLKEKFVPVFGLSQQFARAQAEVADALKVGAISANEAAAANLKLTRTYEDQTQALERLGQRQKENAQRSVNSQLIVPDRAGDIAAYAQELNALQAEFDPLFDAEQKYIAYMERLDRALSVGAVSQDVYNQRAAEAGAILDKAAAKAAGLVVETEKVTFSTKEAAAAQAQFNALLGVKSDFGTAGRAADIEAYGRALTQTRAAYDPVFAAQEKYRSGLQQLRADYAAGAVPIEVFNARLAEQKAAFVDVANGLGMMTAKEREYAEAAQAAARVTQIEGVKANLATDLDAYIKSLDDARAKHDLLYAAERQLHAAQAEINADFARGVISVETQSKALDRAAARFNNQRIEIQKADSALAQNAKTTGLNAYAYQNLSYQVNDVVTSLASGIGVFQTIAQQGGQIVQILQSSGGGIGGALKEIANRVLSISPLVGIFGGIATAAILAATATYKFVAAQRDVQLALLGAGQAAGVSANQIEEIAEKAAKTSTLTITAARDIAKEFLSGGKVYGEAFLPGELAAENFAKASKQSVGDAAKFISSALGNIKTDGVDKLNEQSQNFDAGTRKLIEDLVQTGRTAEAQVVAIQRFGEAFKEAGDKSLTTTSILSRMDQAFNSLATSVGKAVSQRFNGAPLEKQIADLEAARKTTIAVAQAADVVPNTAKIDADIAAKTKALNEQNKVVEENTLKTRANRDASDQSATKTAVSAVANLEALKRDREILNAEMNALERQKSSGVDVPPERFTNNKQALESVNHALRDYENAQGAANMETKKAQEVTDAQLQATKAVTPIEKAMAAAAMVRAQAYGTVISTTDLARKASDAYNESMAQSRQQTINTNRVEDAATESKNQIAKATLEQGNSIEFLKAQRQAEQEAAAGTISADEIETRRKTILADSIATLRQQKTEEIRAARDETQARQALNEKVAAGQMVAAEAQRRQASLVEQSKLQREADAAQGEQKEQLNVTLKALTVTTEEAISAEKRLQVLTMSEESSRQIETLQKEGELLGLNNRDRAIALAQLQAEQALKRQGISVTAPESVDYINKEKLKADLTYAKDQYQRLSQDITSAIGGIFDDMTGQGKKNLTTFLDSFSKGFSKIGTRMLEQNVIGPLINGGLDGKSSSGPGIFDKLGSLFSTGGSAEKAVAGGAEKGIFSSFSDLLKPKNGSATGGFASSTLGGGLVAAGIGGSIGYQSQSPMVGALGGALAGFATPLGPVGALIGGAAGILGGIFGASQAKKQAQKQLQQELQARKEALDQARPQIEALAIQFEGGSVGNLGKVLTDALTQVKQAAKTASDGGDRALGDKLVADYQTYVERMTAAFSDSFNGTAEEMKKGFGTNGPFAQAAQSIMAFGENIKGFIADAGRLGPDQIAAARGAGIESLLKQLDEPTKLTETGTELSRINGTAAGLTQVLKDLGYTADQAATIIGDRTTKALAALADKFNTDLDRKINEAQGKSYINDAADLVKEANDLQADAQSVGGDLGKVQTYFQAAAQKIVDSSELTGDAFNQLAGMFPDLQGKLHAYTADSTKSADEIAAAAAQALSEIQDRKRGYEDRAVAVNFGDNSLSSKLTLFDRSAEWDQWTEMAKGGQALDDLIATQILERNKLIADYNAAVKERKLTFQDRTFAATNDTSTLAGQLAAFERQAGKDRADEIKAGGEAIKDLEAAQGAERVKIITDFAQQASDAMKQRLSGYADRFFAATNDASTLDGQLAAYNRQAEKDRAAEVQAGGQNLVYLEGVQASERAKIITDYAVQLSDTLKARIRAYDDRTFAATNDDSTLEGKLAAFDRVAQQQREDEAKAGGQTMVSLEQALSAERAKIISDYGKEAADALKEQMDAAQSAFETFAKGIKTFLDQMLTGSSSPLSPKDRLTTAQSQYNAQLALAKGGNRDALDNITQYASTLLDASKTYNASSAAYQATFQQVQQTLAALPTQVSAEQFIVNAINSGTTSVVSATQAMQSALLGAVQANNAGAVATALSTYFTTLDTSVDGLLSPQEYLAGLGPLATASEQAQAREIFNSIDQNGDGMISALELLRTSLITAIQANSASALAAALSANFTQLDTSVNGLLDKNELLAGLGPLATQAEQTAARALFNAIDQNGDGQLSKLELANQKADQTNSSLDIANASLTVAARQLNLLSEVSLQNASLYTLTQTGVGYLTQLPQMALQNSSLYDLQVRAYNNLRAANVSQGYPAYATGGWVNGPGSGTSDSMVARVSNGEFVVNAAAARINGPLLEALNDNAGFAMRTVAMPMPVAVTASRGDDSETAALLKQQIALQREEIGLLRQQIATTAAGANHVGGKIDAHAAETRKGNTDRRQDANRPRVAGSRAA